MRASTRHRPDLVRAASWRATNRPATAAGLLVLILALVAAPFAAPSGFAAPPQGPAIAQPTAPTGRDSNRPRGAEAPAKPTPKTKPTPPPVTPTPEPDPPAKAKRDGSQPDRIWPLKSGSFTFTQPFGCVHQIANFYAVAPGCPPDRPVFHTGIDLSAPLGTKIYAAASGWVTHAGPDRDTGLANSQIIIQHDGANRDYGTEYLHWQAAYVREGDYVRAGQPIAEVGSVGYSTGPHLHFSVIDFRTNERIDPMTWLPNDRSAGGYLGLSPDAKRFPIAARAAPLPDYADPAPPPVPKQERVPKHDAKKAAKAKGGNQGKHSGSDNANNGGRKHKKGAGGGKSADATATPTGDAGANAKKRHADQQGGKRNRGDAATPTNGGKQDKPNRHRGNDGGSADAPPADPTATPTPPPAGPGTNLPPPVPPVPGVPPPLLPGGSSAEQPPATATPDAGKPHHGSGHQKHDKHKQKKQKRQKSGATKQA